MINSGQADCQNFQSRFHFTNSTLLPYFPAAFVSSLTRPGNQTYTAAMSLKSSCACARCRSWNPCRQRPDPRLAASACALNEYDLFALEEAARLAGDGRRGRDRGLRRAGAGDGAFAQGRRRWPATRPSGWTLSADDDADRCGRPGRLAAFARPAASTSSFAGPCRRPHAPGRRADAS